jgi:putative glutamine amidotransferase
MRFKGRPLVGITGSPEEGKVYVREEYFRAVWEAGGFPVALSPECDPVESLSQVQGVLIPGGVDLHPSYYGEEERYELKLVPRKRSDFEIALVRASVKEKRPLLAICYGMQLVNVALGGKLYQDVEKDFLGEKKKSLDHRQGFHLITLNENSPFGAGPHKVNTFHHQSCRELAPALTEVARSDDGIIEAFTLKENPFFFGFQWHPERTLDEGDEPLSGEIFTRFIEAARK